MNVLYIIFTGNRFGQFLIFTTCEAAVKWCRAATTWSDEQIAARIQTVHADEDIYGQRYFSVIPRIAA